MNFIFTLDLLIKYNLNIKNKKKTLLIINIFYMNKNQYYM